MWADGGCNTGFGTVTDNLARRWSASGHEVHILAINYLGDPWEAPYKLYVPRKYNPQDFMGITRLKEMVDKLQPDILWIMNDLNVILEGLKVFGGTFPVPTMIYTPIDGDHLPKDWFLSAKAADKVVAYTKFGQDVLKREGDIDSDVIYHGIEHETFWRISEERPLHVMDKAYTNKEDLKEAFGLSGRFVVFAINRNSMRKNYPDTFRVFDEFRKRHDDAILLIHAVQYDEGGNLGDLVERYDLKPYVRISDPKDTFVGLPKSLLTAYYNMADVKLSTSLGEGFGLTDAEAIACGCPVIAQDWSATPEVVGDAGILVKPHRRFTTARMVDFMLPDLKGFERALERLYKDKGMRERLSDNGVKQAQTFEWDEAARNFERLMMQILQQKAG